MIKGKDCPFHSHHANVQATGHLHDTNFKVMKYFKGSESEYANTRILIWQLIVQHNLHVRGVQQIIILAA